MKQRARRHPSCGIASPRAALQRVGDRGTTARVGVLASMLLLGAAAQLPSCAASPSAENMRDREAFALATASARVALADGTPATAIEILAPYEQAAAHDAALQLVLGESRLRIAQQAPDARAPLVRELLARAERNFDRAAASMPEDPLPWIGRAELCSIDQRRTQALAHAKRAEELLLRRPAKDAAFALARFQWKRAETAAAQSLLDEKRSAAEAVVECYARARAFGAAEDFEFVRMCNTALVMLGRGDEALEQIAESIVRATDREPWYDALRRIATMCGSESKLASIYASLESRAPCFVLHWQAGRYWLERANEARMQQDREEAAVAYRHASEQFESCRNANPSKTVEIAREHARALSGAGWCAWEQDELDEAATLWMAALRCSPELAGVGDVMDRSVFDGMEALAARWEAESNAMRANTLLTSALPYIAQLETRHAKWVEKTAEWARQSGIKAQREGRSAEARELFVRSQAGFRRAAELTQSSNPHTAMQLQVEAVEIALYHLIPACDAAERGVRTEVCLSELRALLEHCAAATSTTAEQRTIQADLYQHLGHLLLELRDDKAGAREAFAACLSADPDRARAPQVRWYLERIADSAKEQHR